MQISMPPLGFETKTSVSERTKIFHSPDPLGHCDRQVITKLSTYKMHVHTIHVCYSVHESQVPVHANVTSRVCPGYADVKRGPRGQAMSYSARNSRDQF
jgi:hypothetical protein